MDVDSVPTSMNNLNHQSQIMGASFDEHLAVTLSEDFPYPLHATESNATSPQFELDCNYIEQFLSLPENTDTDAILSWNEQESQQCKSKEGTNKQAVSAGRKRKRQPSQVQDHIIAERKRRELLSQMFISLATMVPGLKKMDKTTVLGEAIKHMKQLQEKVKVLEEVAAEKRTIESVVVFKKSQMIVDNGSSDDNVSLLTADENCASGSSGSGTNGGWTSEQVDEPNELLPQIEVKLSGKTLLLKIYCEKQKGVVAKLIAEINKHEMSITNLSVIPFENLGLDITVVAEMERVFNKNLKDFVRTIRTALRLASCHSNESTGDDHCS